MEVGGGVGSGGRLLEGWTLIRLTSQDVRINLMFYCADAISQTVSLSYLLLCNLALQGLRRSLCSAGASGQR